MPKEGPMTEVTLSGAGAASALKDEGTCEAAESLILNDIQTSL